MTPSSCCKFLWWPRLHDRWTHHLRSPFLSRLTKWHRWSQRHFRHLSLYKLWTWKSSFGFMTSVSFLYLAGVVFVLHLSAASSVKVQLWLCLASSWFPRQQTAQWLGWILARPSTGLKGQVRAVRIERLGLRASCPNRWNLWGLLQVQSQTICLDRQLVVFTLLTGAVVQDGVSVFGHGSQCLSILMPTHQSHFSFLPFSHCLTSQLVASAASSTLLLVHGAGVEESYTSCRLGHSVDFRKCMQHTGTPPSWV